MKGAREARRIARRDPAALARQALRVLRQTSPQDEMIDLARRGLCIWPQWQASAATWRDDRGRALSREAVITGWHCETCGARAALGFDGRPTLACAYVKAWRANHRRRAVAGAAKARATGAIVRASVETVEAGDKTLAVNRDGAPVTEPTPDFVGLTYRKLRLARRRLVEIAIDRAVAKAGE